MSPTLPEQQLLQTLACCSGHGTFESHITIAADATCVNPFRTTCANLGVKPVLIELSHGESASQPMTSAYHRGDLQTVAQEVATLATRLREAGFAVNRVKLEAVATNTGVPIHDDEAAQFAPDCYFEFHLKLLLAVETDLTPIQAICDRFAAKLSRNAFKQRADASIERFVTLRVYHAGRHTAYRELDRLSAALHDAGIRIANTVREYSLFDSNTALDAGWIDAPDEDHA